MQRVLAIFVLFGLSLLLACSQSKAPPGDREPPPERRHAPPERRDPPTVRRDAKGFEVDPPGQWYRGDLHVHATGASNDASKDSTPEAIAAMAKKRGLAFVVLTDHSNSTGSDTTTTDEDPRLFNKGPEFPYWDKAQKISTPGTFLLIDGNEISPVAKGERPKVPRGHIGCVPKDLATFDRSGAFVDRPRGEVTGKQALDQALQRGCFAIVNHPYAPTTWITYDWTSYDYHGMEIWNGGLGLDIFDLYAYDAWRCDLLQGRTVTPIAASDNHRVNIEAPGGGLNPALGYPSTSVFAAQLTWPAIVQGLVQGNVALHEGDSFLQLHGYDADKRHAQGKAIRWLRIRGSVDKRAEGPVVLKLTRATACQDPRPQRTPVTLSQTVLYETKLQPGDRFDHAIEAKAETGVITATLQPAREHYAAFSRALVIP